MYKILFTLSALALGLGCNNSEKATVETNPFKTFFREEIKLFNFKYDSSILIYTENRGTDTAYVIVVEKLDNQIRARILYYPSSYYSSFSDAVDAPIFLYKGALIHIKPNQWDTIANQLEGSIVKLKKPAHPDKNGIIHPFNRKLYWNGALISNDTYGDALFDRIDVILRGNIIDKVLASYPYINGMPG